MPRAASNRPSRAPGPYERSSTIAAPGRASSEGEKDGRRESGLRALSRRISQVFSRAAGRPVEVESENASVLSQQNVRATEPSENSQLYPDTSTESLQSVASQAPSTSRKASVNLSLLRSQRDLRLPAHMIVEAYREALREKAESRVQSRAQKRVESPPAPQSIRPQRKVAKLDRNAMASDVSSSRSVARKPKPIKHKIQLVTKPVLDLSVLPEERKSRPGFISANFDISDDDSDQEVEPSKEKEPVAALVRRPQVASDKLQRALAETPESDSKNTEQQNTGASQSAPASSFSESLKRPVGDNTSAPKFSFGAPPPKESHIPPSSGLPKFSFGADNASAESSGPKSMFGATTDGQSSSKPLFGSQDSTNKSADKPLFSFGSSGSDNKQPEKPSFNFGAGTEKPAEKPVFSFGTQDDKPAEKPAFSFGGANNKPAISFGAKNDDLTNSSDDKTKNNAPSFTFGSKSDEKPAFSFGANGSASSGAGLNKPAETPAQGFNNNVSSSADAPSKPAFSFGDSGNNKPASNGQSSTPLFGFGSKPGADQPTQSVATQSDQSVKPSLLNSGIDKPGSSFAFPAPTGGDKPTFNFNSGHASGKPSFSDSAANGGQQDHKPAFSFGSSTSAAPGGGDNKPAGTTFNFTSAQPKSEEKPTFAFGSSSGPGGSSDKPSFAFGASNGQSVTPEVKPVAALPAPEGSASSAASTPPVFGTNAPASGQNTSANQNQPFAFGNSKPASPAPSAFNFGAAKQNTAGSTTNPSTLSQPAFSFGAPSGGSFGTTSGQAKQPISFGAQQQPPSQPQPFQFGGSTGGAPAPATASDSKASTPFSFGAAAPTSAETPPSFAFGQPQGAPAAGASQFGSRETTPGPGASQQRKIAQVKRRLRR